MKRLNLFPKRNGYLPYINLLYLLFPIANVSLLEKGWGLLLGYALIAMILLAYQQFYWSTSWSHFLFWFCVQLEAILILSIWNTPYNIILGLFPSSFIDRTPEKKQFKTLMSILFISILGAVLVFYFFYPLNVLGQISLFIIVMLISPILFYNHNSRVRLEKELDQANQQVKELVQKEERHRIARDLHDTLGHTLSLITLQSQLVHRLISHQPDKALEETKEIEMASRSALSQVRELVSAMRTLKIDEELKQMENIVMAAGIHFSSQGISDFSNVNPLVQNMVGMCIREAGTNIVKHSEATACDVIIQIEEGSLSVRIHDNGRGITADTVFGNGLEGMKERLTFIDGELDIHSRTGTCLNISVPLISDQEVVSQ